MVSTWYLINKHCEQMLGSVAGVLLLKEAFPEVGHDPRLNAGIHHGALIEGFATFAVVMVSLTLKQKEVNSYFMKTWISSISKMSLHVLSSDLTGGIMNPASVRTLLTF
jgi:aquaporin SIP